MRVSFRVRSLPSRNEAKKICDMTGIEKIEHDGDVHVMCDVPEKARIRASGDVAVWGEIRGHVHAGYPDNRAEVRAFGVARGATVKIGLNYGSESVLLFPGGGATSNGKRRGGAQAVERAAMWTGVYAVVLGVAVLVFPLSTYGLLFDASTTPVGLIRLGGSFLSVVGMQYLGASGSLLGRIPWMQSFYDASVVSRLFLVGVVVLLVLARQLERSWLLFAAMNGAGAASMIKAITADRPGI